MKQFDFDGDGGGRGRPSRRQIRKIHKTIVPATCIIYYMQSLCTQVDEQFHISTSIVTCFDIFTNKKPIWFSTEEKELFKAPGPKQTINGWCWRPVKYLKGTLCLICCNISISWDPLLPGVGAPLSSLRGNEAKQASEICEGQSRANLGLYAPIYGRAVSSKQTPTAKVRIAQIWALSRILASA